MINRSVCLLLFAMLIGCSDSGVIRNESVVNNIPVIIEIVKEDLPGSLYSKLSGDGMKLLRERLELPDNSAYGEIARLNQERGPIEVSSEAYQLLQLAVQFQKETNNVWNPYLGEVEQMWKEIEPGEAWLDVAMDKVQNSEIKLLGDNRIAIEGEGVVNLRRLVIGWAVDGVAEMLISEGVKSAMVSAGSIHRMWGMPLDSAWSLDIPVPNEDSTFYRFKPNDGGICVMNRGNSIDSMNVMIDMDGYLVDSETIVAVWSGSAAKSAVYAEQFYTVKRPQIYDILNQDDELGMFLLYPDTMGYVGESDRKMSPWVSHHTP